MKILHLSDLHLTQENVTLTTIFRNIVSTLQVLKYNFDFFIISGDISQKADMDDYSEFINICDNELSKICILNNKNCRERIILVPGNHDVDYSLKNEIFEGVCLSNNFNNINDNDLKSIIKDARDNPINSKYRLSIDDWGHLSLLKKIPEKYNLRFSKFQTFYDKFYSGIKNKSNKLFDLRTPSDSNDWSIHIFDKKYKVIFIGFNSCYNNDNYFRGANINFKNIDKIAQFIKNKNDYLKIAIWHHGIIESPPRPDYLDLKIIKNIQNLGVQVGIHGHRHTTEVQSLERLFTKPFWLISAGSIGANSFDSPNGNQFNIIDINPHRAIIIPFSKIGDMINYQSSTPIMAEFHEKSLNEKKILTCKSHTREYTFKPDGSISVKVELQNIYTNVGSKIPLAYLNLPYCNTYQNDTIKINNKEIKVNICIKNNKKTFFIIAPNKEISEIKWEYIFSNGYAQDDYEVEIFRDYYINKHLSVNEDARPHSVRFECEKLRLIYSFEELGKLPKYNKNCYLKSFRNDLRNDNYHLGQEIKNVEIKEITKYKIELLVNNPIVGCSYGIKFIFPKTNSYSKAWIGNQKRIINSIMKSMRIDNKSAASCYGRTFTNSCIKGFNDVVIFNNNNTDIFDQNDLNRVFFDSKLFPNTEIMFLLWNSERKMLVPTLGRFCHKNWSREFGYGFGVAGHCFRVGEVSYYNSDYKGFENSIIYQVFHDQQEEIHDWIYCIPIKFGMKGLPIGVVCLASKESETEEEITLQRITSSNQSEEMFHSKAFFYINQFFWTMIKTADGINDNYKSQIEKIRQSFFP